MELDLNGKPGVPSALSLGDPLLREDSLRLADRTHRTLEEMIVTLQLTPGSTLSEASICDRIGIGRTPVREALQRLALEKLVHIVPRYGVIITEIVVPEQMMVIEMRKALEPLIASRAARRSTAARQSRWESPSRLTRYTPRSARRSRLPAIA